MTSPLSLTPHPKRHIVLFYKEQGLSSFFKPLAYSITMYETTLKVASTRSMQMIDITDMVADVLKQSHIQSGTLFVYNPHTTAGLTINEGADPDVQRDILAGFDAMVPKNIVYKHFEGNSRSHIMASLMGASVQLAISEGEIILGTWQRIFFCDFDGPRNRTIHCRITSN